MLKGGAILYAVAMSFIIAVITSSFILLNYYDRLQHTAYITSEKVKGNIISGLRLLMSNTDLVPEDLEKTIDLYGDGNDSVKFKRKTWGLFEVITAHCRSGNIEAQKSILTGYRADTNIALYIPENNKELSICGNSLIRGTCYLSKAGVKSAYIEGKSFTGKKLIEGAIKKAETELPPLNSKLLEKLLTQFRGDPTENDSIIKINGNKLTDTIINSFYNKTIIIESAGNITIASKIEGNIIIRSQKFISVDAYSSLKDVVLIAPKILIQKNFKGSLQAMASDSVIIEESCKLNYPTALVILKEKASTGNSAILIKSNAFVEGIILTYESVYDYSRPSQILTDEKSAVHGILYTNGVVQLKGKVSGSIYCHNFVLSTPSAFYENYLLDATVDATKLSPYFVSTGVLKKTNNKAIAKWLD